MEYDMKWSSDVWLDKAVEYERLGEQARANLCFGYALAAERRGN